MQGFQAPPSFDQEVTGPPPLVRDVEPWLGPGERRPRFEGNHNPHPSVDRHNSNRPSDRPMHQRDDAQPRVENSSFNRSRQLQYEDLDQPAQPQHGDGGHRSGQPQRAPPPRSVFGRLSGALSQGNNGNSLRPQQGDAPQDRNSARPLAGRLGQQRMDSELGRNGPDLRGSRQNPSSEQAVGRRTISWGEREGGARVNGWGDVGRRGESGSGRREETQVRVRVHELKDDHMEQITSTFLMFPNEVSIYAMRCFHQKLEQKHATKTVPCGGFYAQKPYWVFCVVAGRFKLKMTTSVPS